MKNVIEKQYFDNGFLLGQIYIKSVELLQKKQSLRYSDLLCETRKGYYCVYVHFHVKAKYTFIHSLTVN